jgi:UTP-glucose-1-phosphate uridylyltransferase
MLLKPFLFSPDIFATFGKVHQSEGGDCIVHNSVVMAFRDCNVHNSVVTAFRADTGMSRNISYALNRE